MQVAVNFEKSKRDFLWGADDENRKDNLVHWEMVSQLKKLNDLCSGWYHFEKYGFWCGLLLVANMVWAITCS